MISTSAANAIRQALTVSVDIGSRSRISCTARPPVPHKTPAAQIASSPARGLIGLAVLTR